MKRAWLIPLFLFCLVGCRRDDASAQHGAEHLQYYGCGSCHTVPGIPGAVGTVGPPLTALGSRTYIAGSVANSPETLALWIQHPHKFRPDTAMPEMNVTPRDAADIARYLDGLR